MGRMYRLWTLSFLAAAVVAFGATGCQGREASAQGLEADLPQNAAAAASATMPPGREGNLIRYGQTIVDDTQDTVKSYVVANMNCSACHLGGGTKPKGGSFLGIYARFPQWNQRAHRFIALQDRIAECFLNSMNGKPPAYTSREMLAVVAYIAWLSRGAQVGAGFPNQDYPLLPMRKTNVAAGQSLYTAKCAACHQANGAGLPPTLPPLWGSQAFNDDAGMSRLPKMASFVRYNMPANAPGTLTDQQAYDISAWVLTHPRPVFDRTREVQFPPVPAGDF
jgi:thiosulfate dehydrogenase